MQGLHHPVAGIQPDAHAPRPRTPGCPEGAGQGCPHRRPAAPDRYFDVAKVRPVLAHPVVDTSPPRREKLATVSAAGDARRSAAGSAHPARPATQRVQQRPRHTDSCPHGQPAVHRAALRSVTTRPLVPVDDARAVLFPVSAPARTAAARACSRSCEAHPA